MLDVNFNKKIIINLFTQLFQNKAGFSVTHFYRKAMKLSALNKFLKNHDEILNLLFQKGI